MHILHFPICIFRFQFIWQAMQVDSFRFPLFGNVWVLRLIVLLSTKCWTDPAPHSPLPWFLHCIPHFWHSRWPRWPRSLWIYHIGQSLFAAHTCRTQRRLLSDIWVCGKFLAAAQIMPSAYLRRGQSDSASRSSSTSRSSSSAGIRCIHSRIPQQRCLSAAQQKC